MASLEASRHQCWELHASMGKSRIIACMALIALSMKMFRHVHILVPSGALLRRDKKDFIDYWVLAGLEKVVKYHEKLDFKPTEKDLVIVDEADKPVLDDPLKFRSVTAVCSSICLTASLPNSSQGKLE